MIYISSLSHYFRSQECRHHAQLFTLKCFKVIQFLYMQDKYFTNGKISTGLGEVGGGTGSGYLEFLCVLTLQRPEKNFSSHGLLLCLIPWDRTPQWTWILEAWCLGYSDWIESCQDPSINNFEVIGMLAIPSFYVSEIQTHVQILCSSCSLIH